MSRWPGKAEKQATTFGKLNRSQLMSLVRSTGNLTTEVRLAKLMKAARLRGYRRHLPITGHPDFAWTKEKVAVFVHGCFWHGHDCGRNLTPKQNVKAWREKIIRNKRRDRSVARELRKQGWVVIHIWECRLAEYPSLCLRRVSTALGKRRAEVSTS